MGLESGPLFGVQFSQLPCSDLSARLGDGMIGPKRSPLGLAADPGGIPLYKNGVVVGGIGVMNIMLVSVTDGETLLRIAEKVHTAVGGASIRLDDGISVRITVSVGATLIEGDISVDTVTARADTALYEAKNAGRDRVALYDPGKARGRAQG